MQYNCRVLSEICSIKDTLLSTNIKKIKETWIKDNSVNGRTIYNLLLDLQYDTVLEFKFKNKIPNEFNVGYASFINQNGQLKGLWGTFNNGIGIWYNRSSWAAVTMSRTSDTVFRISTENLHKLNWYADNTLKAYRTTYSDLPLNLRLDIFDNDEYELEYLNLIRL